MRIIPSVEIEADAVLRLTLLPQSAAHFSPTWSRREGEREGGKEGGREGWRDGGREGIRKGGRGSYLNGRKGPYLYFNNSSSNWTFIR